MVVRTTLDGGIGLVRGDVFSIYRTVNNLPAGRTVAEAWLMVKTGYGVADGSATISKTVTTSDVAGTGHVEDTGATDGSARIRFDLSNTNTTAVTADTVYYYDIQIRLDNSDIFTIETGTATWMAQVVQDT